MKSKHTEHMSFRIIFGAAIGSIAGMAISVCMHPVLMPLATIIGVVFGWHLKEIRRGVMTPFRSKLHRAATAMTIAKASYLAICLIWLWPLGKYVVTNMTDADKSFPLFGAIVLVAFSLLPLFKTPIDRKSKRAMLKSYEKGLLPVFLLKNITDLIGLQAAQLALVTGILILCLVSVTAFVALIAICATGVGLARLMRWVNCQKERGVTMVTTLTLTSIGAWFLQFYAMDRMAAGSIIAANGCLSAISSILVCRLIRRIAESGITMRALAIKPVRWADSHITRLFDPCCAFVFRLSSFTERLEEFAPSRA